MIYLNKNPKTTERKRVRATETSSKVPESVKLRPFQVSTAYIEQMEEDGKVEELRKRMYVDDVPGFDAQRGEE